MTIRPVWIVIAASALAALLYVWWISTHDKVWFARPVPAEGEASYNDYYVLQQALRAQRIAVQSLPHLPAGIDHWGGRDTLLLGSDSKTLSPAQAEALLDWVARGGRLLVAGHSEGANGGELSFLLERIGLGPAGGWRCVRLQARPKSHGSTCFHTLGLESSERGNFRQAVGSEGAGKGWILVRRDWGKGEVEVIGDFARMHNEALGTALNADWSWQVIAPLLQGGVFRIVYRNELPPLYVYLVRYGWFALLPLAMALLGWLWMRSQRFGPTLPMPAPDRRALGEHIQASGEFLLRRGLLDALYQPLRRRFDEQLRRRDPELAALPIADIAKVLAQRHAMPVKNVQQALRPPEPKARKEFIANVQILLQLIRKP